MIVRLFSLVFFLNLSIAFAHEPPQPIDVSGVVRCSDYILPEIEEPGWFHHFYKKAYFNRYGDWELIGQDVLDRHPKLLLIAVPHTSLHDAAAMIAIRIQKGIPLHVFMKSSWPNRPVIGPMLQRFGIIGIDQNKNEGMVEKTVAMFNSNDKVQLVITPEGTRALRPHWRSGFYWIALGANVPISLVHIDPNLERFHGGKKVKGRAHRMIITEPFYLPSNMDEGMELIEKRYRQTTDSFQTSGGFYPELFSPIRLKKD
ncbi:MAG: 1-acyl-sn-glycerol-3-phosphate acyltransferase [Bacteriovoracia bacterium]